MIRLCGKLSSQQRSSPTSTAGLLNCRSASKKEDRVVRLWEVCGRWLQYMCMPIEWELNLVDSENYSFVCDLRGMRFYRVSAWILSTVGWKLSWQGLTGVISALVTLIYREKEGRGKGRKKSWIPLHVHQSIWVVLCRLEAMQGRRKTSPLIKS